MNAGSRYVLLITLLFYLSACATGSEKVDERAAHSPAPDVIKTEIREALERLANGSPDHGELAIDWRVANPAELFAFYEQRGFRPLWREAGPLEGQQGELLSAIESSAKHGFNPDRYHLVSLSGGKLPAATREILLTDALLSQAHHRFSGVVNRPVEAWFIDAHALDGVPWLQSLVLSKGSIAESLDRLWPAHAEYWSLIAKRESIASLPDTETVSVPDAGKVLRKGDEHAAVRLLKARLLGPGEYSAVFDGDLFEAVTAFQSVSGLEPDGVVGPATLEIINATRYSWLSRIDANLERWRWLPRVMPPTYIRVNIAAFTLRVIEEGRDVIAMDIIVGRPYRQTPVFTEKMSYLVFNPFWNVPASIANRDKLPLLRKDAAAMAQQGYEVKLPGAQDFVPVDSVAWAGIQPGRFLLRQRPGPQNALGRVKFMMPNAQNVYLHDTPDRNLFGRIERTFSSGCIRLSRPGELAGWVLEHDRSAYARELDQLMQPGPTTTVILSSQVPVYVVYFTAFVDPAGDVVFRRDIYDRDEAIVRRISQATEKSSG